MEYQTKSVLIDAIRFKDDEPESLIKIQDFMDDRQLRVSYADPEHPVIRINTLSRIMDAHIGDYIIKNSVGSFYPCNPDVFSMIYEQVE